ncbi:hypothetical protein [Streptomyces sp.]|uniref:hypothetical protein n=1 Tax=Streptomyces sp. TaxID=1931 RepID=UPI002811A2E6|nr:hypothetical protein [Streptomyces sp.]
MMPQATSVAAAALVFTMIFERDFGMINWALSAATHRAHSLVSVLCELLTDEPRAPRG